MLQQFRSHLSLSVKSETTSMKKRAQWYKIHVRAIYEKSSPCSIYTVSGIKGLTRKKSNLLIKFINENSCLRDTSANTASTRKRSWYHRCYLLPWVLLLEGDLEDWRITCLQKRQNGRRETSFISLTANEKRHLSKWKMKATVNESTYE